MATSIELEDKVVAALQAQADLLRISLPELLTQIATAASPVNQPPDLTDEEFERALDEVSDSMPTAISTYSREDIYFDHD